MSALNGSITSVPETNPALEAHEQPHPTEELQTAVGPTVTDPLPELNIASEFPNDEMTLCEVTEESLKPLQTSFVPEGEESVAEQVIRDTESTQEQVVQSLEQVEDFANLEAMDEETHQLHAEMHALQNEAIQQQESNEVIQTVAQAESIQKMDYSLTPASTIEENSPTHEASTPSYMDKVNKERELSASSKRERSENWQHSETKLLLRLWEKYYNELKKYKRNSTVWDRIAEELQAAGFDRNAAQCKSRVRVLMAKYKACIVDDVEDPEAIESFDYYQDLKKLVSGNFTHIDMPEHKSSSPNPFNIMRTPNGALTLGDDSVIDEDERDHDSVTTQPMKKRKMVDQLYELVTYLVQRDEKRAKEREEDLQIRQQRHEAKLKERAERIQRREERAKAREQEMQRVFTTQLELMKSLVETINRPEI
ncbi:hypothetical protein K493DRAFT_406147 [Basidiobolus meristosporus CBS 931.73]|uniref:Myb-like domain-containing protein n=1 Tax=Basidiobolus meristosporus CBS 931.73 TaxID=1314790 RepID=A0A1Y1YP10_9FUNG|nr:hypothetical protein K493DRAFT_406147 [Basidiobolus meristosporus CBS 931.73]|eukprot:ORX99741.1 hypothetical protein K493DRAFT_406147 [Basidiobolus meristosporus CBS 931.73]